MLFREHLEALSRRANPIQIQRENREWAALPFDDLVQSRSHRLGNVEENQRLAIHLANHSVDSVRVQLARLQTGASCLLLL